MSLRDLYCYRDVLSLYRHLHAPSRVAGLGPLWIGTPIWPLEIKKYTSNVVVIGMFVMVPYQHCTAPGDHDLDGLMTEVGSTLSPRARVDTY